MDASQEPHLVLESEGELKQRVRREFEKLFSSLQNQNNPSSNSRSLSLFSRMSKQQVEETLKETCACAERLILVQQNACRELLELSHETNEKALQKKEKDVAQAKIAFEKLQQQMSSSTSRSRNNGSVKLSSRKNPSFAVQTDQSGLFEDQTVKTYREANEQLIAKIAEVKRQYNEQLNAAKQEIQKLEAQLKMEKALASQALLRWKGQVSKKPGNFPVISQALESPQNLQRKRSLDDASFDSPKKVKNNISDSERALAGQHNEIVTTSTSDQKDLNLTKIDELQFQSQIEALEKELKELRPLAAVSLQLEASIKHFEERTKDLEDKIAGFLQRENEHEAKSAEYEIRITEIQASYNSLKWVHNECESALNKLRSDVSALEEAKLSKENELEAKLTEDKNRITELEDSVNSFKANHKECESTVNKLRNDSALLKTKFEDSELRLSVQVRSLSQQLDTAKIQLAEKTNFCDTLLTQLDTVREEYQELKDSLCTPRTTGTGVDQNSAVDTTRIQDLQESRQRLQATINNMEQERVTLRKIITALEMSVNGLRQQIGVQNGVINRLTQEKLQLQLVLRGIKGERGKMSGNSEEDPIDIVTLDDD